MKDDTVKRQFVKLFDEISIYEGGTIYNHGILKAVRTYTDLPDILYHVFLYAESRGLKVKEIINSTASLKVLRKVIDYATWYESLNDKKRNYLKEKGKREHFEASR